MTAYADAVGFDGSGYLISLAIIGGWVATVAVIVGLLRTRRSAVAQAALVLCGLAQVAMAVRAVQVDLLPIALTACVAAVLAALVWWRWAQARSALGR